MTFLGAWEDLNPAQTSCTGYCSVVFSQGKAALRIGSAKTAATWAICLVRSGGVAKRGTAAPGTTLLGSSFLVVGHECWLGRVSAVGRTFSRICEEQEREGSSRGHPCEAKALMAGEQRERA